MLYFSTFLSHKVTLGLGVVGSYIAGPKTCPCHLKIIFVEVYGPMVSKAVGLIHPCKNRMAGVLGVQVPNGVQVIA